MLWDPLQHEFKRKCSRLFQKSELLRREKKVDIEEKVKKFVSSCTRCKGVPYLYRDKLQRNVLFFFCLVLKVFVFFCFFCFFLFSSPSFLFFLGFLFFGKPGKPVKIEKNQPNLINSQISPKF